MKKLYEESFESWIERRVISDPQVLGGQPVFVGTRLSVERVGDLILQGYELEAVEDYPYLTEEDLKFAPQWILRQRLHDS